MPPPWPPHQAADSLQAVALGPGDVHVAAQSTVEVLQGFLFHLHLPLGQKDVLAREGAPSAGDVGEKLAVAATRPLPCWVCTRPDLP